LSLACAGAAHAADYSGPLFDGHLHYNYEAQSPLMKGYRTWLGDLPPEAARGIGWENGAGPFGID
jgi:hypothetical protein